MPCALCGGVWEGQNLMPARGRIPSGGGGSGGGRRVPCGRADPVREGRCRVCWGRGGTAPYAIQKGCAREGLQLGVCKLLPLTQRADVLF